MAFLDHASRGDNQASVKVVDPRGAVREIARSASNGLAWSASGDGVLFPTGQALRAATLSGRTRVVFRSIGGVFLQDVSPRGQVLVSRTTMQREIVAQAPGEARARNLSWLDWSFPTALSDDGRVVLFEEQNLAGSEYGLFLRNTDGTPPVRLGDGRALALSPDGKWVVATRQGGEREELVLLPTGAGETRRVGPASIVASAASFLPGGERVVLSGHVAGGGTRLYVSTSRPWPRPDQPRGNHRLLRRPGVPRRAAGLRDRPRRGADPLPHRGGEPRGVPGTSLEDVAIRWTADGRSLFVQRRAGLPARIERVDVATGERQPWLELRRRTPRASRESAPST